MGILWDRTRSEWSLALDNRGPPCPRVRVQMVGAPRQLQLGAHFLSTIYIYILYWLVVWNIFYFSIQLGMSSSQLTFIFFRGVGIPPTSIGSEVCRPQLNIEAKLIHCEIESFAEKTSRPSCRVFPCLSCIMVGDFYWTIVWAIIIIILKTWLAMLVM